MRLVTPAKPEEKTRTGNVMYLHTNRYLDLSRLTRIVCLREVDCKNMDSQESSAASSEPYSFLRRPPGVPSRQRTGAQRASQCLALSVRSRRRGSRCDGDGGDNGGGNRGGIGFPRSLRRPRRGHRESR